MEIIWPCPLSNGLLASKLLLILHVLVCDKVSYGEPQVVDQWYLVCNCVSIGIPHFHDDNLALPP